MDADVIVVGGGHAGIEAAFAAAHLGKRVILLTLDIKMIGNTPCNPHIGGSAKGIVVREIDALGGMMGVLADHDPLQIKMLNTAKGPGVRCLRAQVDKYGYPAYVQSLLKEEENIEIVEGEAIDFIRDGNRIKGILLNDGTKLNSRAVVLTTGTYMDSRVIKGQEIEKSGPDGVKASLGLSESLRRIGIRTFRLKTGTPPRIKKSTIDYSKAAIEKGHEGHLNFSYLSQEYRPLEGQIDCHLIYTSPQTLDIIRKNLDKSALFDGTITSKGPRYCPSIESKIVRFGDKERHQLFLEPETRDGESIYLQGFSTGFGRELQEELVHSLPGLEEAEILKYAYQIEYDALEPFQFDSSLKLKEFEGLYAAGQILGTSGYEEAGGLGLMAGINAARYLDGKPPFVLRRDEAYIGVMIDDLVTKGTEEPYRLLSSRAEYRLLLRHDNADARLTPKAMEIGLASDGRKEVFLKSKEKKEKAEKVLSEVTISPSEELNKVLSESGYPASEDGFRGKALLKRPGISFGQLYSLLPDLAEIGLNPDASKELETEIKYEGYIAMAKEEANRVIKAEETLLPDDIDYSSLQGLRLEAREKLIAIRPRTLGQASRISGVTPADCAALLLALKKTRK